MLPPTFTLYQRYHYASRHDDGSLWTMCRKFPVPNGAVTQDKPSNCDECVAALEAYEHLKQLEGAPAEE